MAKYGVELTGGKREELLARVNREHDGAAEIKRANILLTVDRSELAELHVTDEKAARIYHSTPKTVYNLKRKLVEEGFDGVLSKKRRKAHGNRKIDCEAEARIVALTCTALPRDMPGGHRSSSRRRASNSATPSLSATSPWATCFKNDLKPWAREEWCVPERGGEFIATVEDVPCVF